MRVTMHEDYAIENARARGLGITSGASRVANGRNQRVFKQGKTYDLPESLAKEICLKGYGMNPDAAPANPNAGKVKNRELFNPYARFIQKTAGAK